MSDTKNNTPQESQQKQQKALIEMEIELKRADIERLKITLEREKGFLEETNCKIKNLKNQPLYNRIENARRNIEALTRCSHLSSIDTEMIDALKKNIKVINEVTNIK